MTTPRPLSLLRTRHLPSALLCLGLALMAGGCGAGSPMAPAAAAHWPEPAP